MYLPTHKTSPCTIFLPSPLTHLRYGLNKENRQNQDWEFGLLFVDPRVDRLEDTVLQKLTKIVIKVIIPKILVVIVIIIWIILVIHVASYLSVWQLNFSVNLPPKNYLFDFDYCVEARVGIPIVAGFDEPGSSIDHNRWKLPDKPLDFSMEKIGD